MSLSAGKQNLTVLSLVLLSDTLIDNEAVEGKSCLHCQQHQRHKERNTGILLKEPLKKTPPFRCSLTVAAVGKHARVTDIGSVLYSCDPPRVSFSRYNQCHPGVCLPALFSAYQFVSLVLWPRMWMSHCPQCYGMVFCLEFVDRDMYPGQEDTWQTNRCTHGLTWCAYQPFPWTCIRLPCSTQLQLNCHSVVFKHEMGVSHGRRGQRLEDGRVTRS